MRSIRRIKDRRKSMLETDGRWLFTHWRHLFFFFFPWFPWWQRYWKKYFLLWNSITLVFQNCTRKHLPLPSYVSSRDYGRRERKVDVRKWKYRLQALHCCFLWPTCLCCHPNIFVKITGYYFWYASNSVPGSNIIVSLNSIKLIFFTPCPELLHVVLQSIEELSYIIYEMPPFQWWTPLW